jgi:arginyl-tRNA synthetase
MINLSDYLREELSNVFCDYIHNIINNNEKLLKSVFGEDYKSEKLLELKETHKHIFEEFNTNIQHFIELCINRTTINDKSYNCTIKNVSKNKENKRKKKEVKKLIKNLKKTIDENTKNSSELTQDLKELDRLIQIDETDDWDNFNDSTQIDVDIPENYGQFSSNLSSIVINVVKTLDYDFPWSDMMNFNKGFIMFYNENSQKYKMIDKVYPGHQHIDIKLNMKWVMNQIYDLCDKSYHMETDNPETIVVDFSSPNMAKKMHLGHLRSTIIGDVICKYFEFLGHNVKRVNHLGDWGRPFAIVITHLLNNYKDYQTEWTAEFLQEIYTKATKQFASDHIFENKVYGNVKKLQEKDPKIYEMWKRICQVSRNAYQKIYDELDIKITDIGESFYQDSMKDMIEELDTTGKLLKSMGMKIINIDGIANPFILLKSTGKGGNFTYDTSDLAALKYRINEMKADRIYYVVDSGQSNHFDLLFAVAEYVGYYDPTKQIIKHIKFGLVQSPSGVKLSARTGQADNDVNIGLQDILDMGKKHAFEETQTNNDKRKQKANQSEDDKILSDDEMLQISNQLSYNCIKYFELSHKRTVNYKINYEKLFNKKGNTAVYVNYTYARAYHIWDKYKTHFSDNLSELNDNAQLEFNTYKPEPSEIKLILHVLKFKQVIDSIDTQKTEDMMIHHLTDYLYEMCQLIGKFYSSPNCDCIHLNPNPRIVYYNRILMIAMVLKVMKTLFDILGIKIINKI